MPHLRDQMRHFYLSGTMQKYSRQSSYFFILPLCNSFPLSLYMITDIKKFITANYPEVSIVTSTEVEPTRKIENEEASSPLKFYDVTFEYEGQRFSKLFHTRLQETVEQQFNDAVRRYKVMLPAKDKA